MYTLNCLSLNWSRKVGVILLLTHASLSDVACNASAMPVGRMASTIMWRTMALDGAASYTHTRIFNDIEIQNNRENKFISSFQNFNSIHFDFR